MISLPANATLASQRRAQLAAQLAQTCPPNLADEIALVGSTAHGFADDESDLELNLWAEAIPPLDQRIAWLTASAATDLHVENAPRPDNSYWIGFRIDGVPGEVGWQTFAALQTQLDLILSGSTIDRKTLAFADILIAAIPIRTTGKLAGWQSTLNQYSDAVQHALINFAVERWSRPDAIQSASRLAQRGERLALTEILLADLDTALRVLYAAHRRWEPSRKWTLTVAETFAPADLIPRIDAVLSDPSLERRVELCARLCLDMLALVSQTYEVSAAVKMLNSALESE